MSNKKEDEFIELLTEQEICELHEAFNIFDVESDGSISANQLMMLMNALNQNISETDMDNILQEFNIEKNGQIYFNLFLKIMAKRLKILKEDDDKHFKKMFDQLDRNKNGQISVHELRYIMIHKGKDEGITEEDIEIMMKEADTDGDGYISFQEFMDLMKG